MELPHGDPDEAMWRPEHEPPSRAEPNSKRSRGSPTEQPAPKTVPSSKQLPPGKPVKAPPVVPEIVPHPHVQPPVSGDSTPKTVKFANPPEEKVPQTTGKKPDADSNQDQPSASSWEPSESTGPVLPLRLEEDSDDTVEYDDDALYVLEDEPYWKSSNAAHRACAQTASFSVPAFEGEVFAVAELQTRLDVARELLPFVSSACSAPHFLVL